MPAKGVSAKNAVAERRREARTPKRFTGEAEKLVARVGRPSKLTRELIFKICDLILAGNYRETAAAANGISRATLDNWIAKGQEYDGMDPAELDEQQLLYVEFLGAYKTCEGQAEVLLLDEVREAGPRWQAPMTILARRWPANWREKSELDVNAQVGLKQAVLDPEKVEEELAAFGMPAALAVARGPDAVRPPEEE